MKTFMAAAFVACMLTSLAAGQEVKPVPKHSVRVNIAGCSKGALFVAGRPAEDQAGAAVPEGTRLRMLGPKALMRAIKAHEGSQIELTGLMRKGQFEQRGVVVGGIRIMPGAASTAGGGGQPAPVDTTPAIDVEGWRAIPGDCPSR